MERKTLARAGGALVACLAAGVTLIACTANTVDGEEENIGTQEDAVRPGRRPTPKRPRVPPKKPKADPSADPTSGPTSDPPNTPTDPPTNPTTDPPSDDTPAPVGTGTGTAAGASSCRLESASYKYGDGPEQVCGENTSANECVSGGVNVIAECACSAGCVAREVRQTQAPTCAWNASSRTCGADTTPDPTGQKNKTAAQMCASACQPKPPKT